MKKKVIGNYQPMFPMNLQFFAEENSAGATDSTQPSESIDEAGGTEEKPSEKSYEDALAEIAQAQAEVKKLKAERDAALKKSGEATKALRAKMTEAEIEAEKKQAEEDERRAHVEELENFQKKTLAKERYSSLFGGFELPDMKLVSELSEKAADAETNNDMDALTEVFRQVVIAVKKNEKSQYMGTRGRVNMGDGDEISSMTKEEILAIADRDKRQEEIAKHLDLFQ